MWSEKIELTVRDYDIKWNKNIFVVSINFSP